MIGEPLSEELLRYYAYVPLPCQRQLLPFYRFEVVRARLGRAQTWEEDATKMLEESQEAFGREMSWYAGERLVNLIITDLSCRSSTLGGGIERICQAMVQKAIENDGYFARLRAYTPQYWNERNYSGPIQSLKARLVTLLQQLNHVGQILDKELKSEKGAETGQEGIARYMSSADLAKYHGVDAEALRKRLERYRAKHILDTGLFVESQDRGKNKPKYLYDAEKVLPIIQEIKKHGASVKRPSEET
jgi:hypothetical protein